MSVIYRETWIPPRIRLYDDPIRTRERLQDSQARFCRNNEQAADDLWVEDCLKHCSCCERCWGWPCESTIRGDWCERMSCECGVDEEDELP